jgi:hypothetical protein
MTDVREAILVRLHEVVAAVPSVVNAERNRIQWDDTELPAVSVIEGDEEITLLNDDGSFTRPSLRPYLMTAFPQVYIRAQARDDVGTDINTLRLAILAAVLSDSALNALTFKGRGIRPHSLTSQLHAARTMDGVHILIFAISYLLKPEDL